MKLDTTSLTGLRGLACLHIAIYHFVYNSVEMREVDLMGNIAISLFYLLSGFSLTMVYGQRLFPVCKTRQMMIVEYILDLIHYPCVPLGALANNYVSSEATGTAVFDFNFFLVKRFARIGPLYQLTNILSIPLYFNMPVLPTIGQAITSTLFFSSWLNFYPLNGLLWTVSTIVSFYFMFPWMMKVASNLGSITEFRSVAFKMYLLQLAWCVPYVAAFFVSDALDFGISYKRFYGAWRLFPLARVPVFFMGCCAAKMRLLELQSADVNPAKPLLCSSNSPTQPFLLYMTIVIVGFGLSMAGFKSVTFNFQMIMELLSPILMFDFVLNLASPNLVSLMTGPEIHRTAIDTFLRTTVMQFMGRISMAFYMIHVVIYFYFSYSVRVAQGHPVNNMFNPCPLSAIIIIFPLSILWAWVLTDHVESPATSYILGKCNYYSEEEENRAVCKDNVDQGGSLEKELAFTQGDVIVMASAARDNNGGNGEESEFAPLLSFLIGSNKPEPI